MAHLRYPEDLFKVQRDAARPLPRHRPAGVLPGQDFWQVPDDPTQPASGQAAAAVLPDAADAGPERAGVLADHDLRCQRPAREPGGLHGRQRRPGDPTTARSGCCNCRRTTPIAGPEQVQNNFESDPAVASSSTCLRRGDSTVTYGNLLTLPGRRRPALRRAGLRPGVVRRRAYPAAAARCWSPSATRSAFADTLQEALDKVFSGAGSSTGGGGTAAATPAPRPPPTPTPSGTATPAPRRDGAWQKRSTTPSKRSPTPGGAGAGRLRGVRRGAGPARGCLAARRGRRRRLRPTPPRRRPVRRPSPTG